MFRKTQFILVASLLIGESAFAPSSPAMLLKSLCRKVPSVLFFHHTRPNSDRRLPDIFSKVPPLGEWHCDSGGCIPFTAQIYRELKTQEPDRWRILWAQPQDATIEHKGRQLRVITGHQFLVEKATEGTNDELIVDPTIRQFFSPSGYSVLPEVFIGTREELRELFREQAKYLRTSTMSGLIQGGPPDELVEIYYGFTGSRVDETSMVSP